MAAKILSSRLAPLTALVAGLFLASPALAQFKTIGPPPYSQPVARQKIKALLANLTPDNQQATIDQLTKLLTWYRDAFNDELVKAWQAGANRTNLTALLNPLVDPAAAASLVAISWQQRDAIFTPDYEPVLADLMGRFPDSAKPVLDDLQGNLAALNLTRPEAETVCRILFALPDIRNFKKIALQVLPRYRSIAEPLLKLDLQSGEDLRRQQATVWERDLRWGEWAAPSPLASRDSPRPAAAPAARSANATPTTPPRIAVSNFPRKVAGRPEVAGAVYIQDNSGALVPLERNSLVLQKKAAPPSWEIKGAAAPIRVSTGDSLLFVIRTGDNVDPAATVNLLPLDSIKKNRRTKPNPENANAPLAVALHFTPAGDSTYGLTPLAPLGPGEYCFSLSTSADAYCFAIDPAFPIVRTH